MEKDRDEIDWAALRKWSGTMCGNVNRLPVAVAVLELGPEEVYPQAIKERLGLPSSTRAKEQLECLVTAGLLDEAVERPRDRAGRRPKVYPKRDDEFWDCLAELTRRRFAKKAGAR